MPPIATDEDTRAKQIADLLKRADGFFDGDDSSLTRKSLTEKMKEVDALFSEWKKVDPVKVQAELEKVKAAQEQFTRTVQHRRGRGYVSGQEDVAKDFNLVKFLIGAKTGDYKDCAFEKEFVDQKVAALKAAHVIGDDTRGGAFVPDEVIPDVIGAVYTKSAFIDLSGEDGTATKVTVVEGLSGGQVKIPEFKGGMIAYWTGEEDEIAESNAQTADLNMDQRRIGVLAKITDSMRRFAGFGFDRLLRRDMIRALTKKIDWTIAYGTGGDHTPRGIANTKGIKIYSAQSKKFGVLGTDALAGAQFQADWLGAELNYDDLDELQLILSEDDIEEDDSFAWVSSRRFFSKLKRLKLENYSGQTTGQPYLLGAPMITYAKLRELIGDFDWTNQIKTDLKPGASIGAPSASGTAKHSDLFGGNLGEFLFGRWVGTEVDDDAGKGKGFASGTMYLRLLMHAGTACRRTRALFLCPDAKVRA